MTRPLQRSWPLLLFVLLTVLTISKIGPNHHAGTLVAAEPQAEQKILANDGLHEPEQPGAAAFKQAQKILLTLEASPRRSSRYSRPVGTINTMWYYVKKLFISLFMNGPSSTVASATKKLSPVLSSAIGHLEVAARENDKDAIYTLADMSFYGRYGYLRNHTKAFENYERLASMDGNSTAQQQLGFMFATGLDGVAEKDQAKALLHHTFAADAGDARGQMTVAYRHHAGVGTPRNCEKAVIYYKHAADRAIEFIRDGPPGGRRLVREAYRIADEEGGVYGEGASFSSAGHNARNNPAPDSDQTLDDYLEYLDLMSRKGQHTATFRLGQYHYDGSRYLRQDYTAAKEFFLDVARRYWSKDGKIRPDTEPGLDKLASKAAGYLGNMFMRGEGMDQNFAKAKVWFRRGIENADALCQYGMGIMHLYGLGMPADPVRASEFFGAAADQDYGPAQVRMGVLMLDQGDLAPATRYLEFAARHNHPEAIYYLAELTNTGVGRDRSCATASLFYKIVAERAEELHTDFPEANELFEAGDTEAALVLYMQAAEQGYENAQANVAYILDRNARSYPSPLHALFPSIFRYTSARLSDAVLALTYWTRSAKQANVDSLVKMGDYYLSGLGSYSPPASNTSATSPSSNSPAAILPASSFTAAPDKAAACYAAAAETQMSAQAYWNLGWMHENGLGGLAQDFHLAKRYYDQSLETNAEAYLPVTLALFRLRLRSWWNGITGGSAQSIRSDAGSARRRTFTEWLAEFLIADLEEYERELTERREAGLGDPREDEWEGAATGEEGLYNEEWEDDAWLEMVLFATMAAGLVALMWYRQFVQGQRERREREERERQGRAGEPDPAPQPEPQQDRGMFPAPDEPGFAGWVAGGIGH